MMWCWSSSRGGRATGALSFFGVDVQRGSRSAERSSGVSRLSPSPRPRYEREQATVFESEITVSSESENTGAGISRAFCLGVEFTFQTLVPLSCP